MTFCKRKTYQYRQLQHHPAAMTAIDSQILTRTRQPRESTELIVNDIYELQVVRSELL